MICYIRWEYYYFLLIVTIWGHGPYFLEKKNYWLCIQWYLVEVFFIQNIFLPHDKKGSLSINIRSTLTVADSCRICKNTTSSYFYSVLMYKITICVRYRHNMNGSIHKVNSLRPIALHYKLSLHFCFLHMHFRKLKQKWVCPIWFPVTHQCLCYALALCIM